VTIVAHANPTSRMLRHRFLGLREVFRARCRYRVTVLIARMSLVGNGWQSNFVDTGCINVSFKKFNIGDRAQY